MKVAEADQAHPYDVHGLRSVTARILPKKARAMLSELNFQAEKAAFKWSRTPPRRLRLHISPDWFDFRLTGRDQVEFLVQKAGLKPEDHVLDVACGVGRIAIPLADFLNSEGRYAGFDVFDAGIDWCRKNISANDSRFSFLVANVRTDFRPQGADASAYAFEYDDASFDFCYAGSIFTHLTESEARNYLQQIRRVLKPGGRFVSTWLTYSDMEIAHIPGMKARLDRLWPFDQGGWRYRNDKSPGESVAYEQGRIRDLYRAAGLTVIEPFNADASYNCARIPATRSMGIHLHHSASLVAVVPPAGPAP
jgi:SAM-dependent methyltransferase